MDAVLSSMEATVLGDRAAHTVFIIILRTEAGVYSCGLQRYNRTQQLMSHSWTVSLSVKMTIWQIVLSPYSCTHQQRHHLLPHVPLSNALFNNSNSPAELMLQISANPQKQNVKVV